MSSSAVMALKGLPGWLEDVARKLLALADLLEGDVKCLRISISRSAVEELYRLEALYRLGVELRMESSEELLLELFLAGATGGKQERRPGSQTKHQRLQHPQSSAARSPQEILRSGVDSAKHQERLSEAVAG